jgi:hypothetical protein
MAAGRLHRMVGDWDCIVRKLVRVRDGRVKPDHDGIGRTSHDGIGTTGHDGVGTRQGMR